MAADPVMVAAGLISAMAANPRPPSVKVVGGTVQIFDDANNRAYVAIDGDLDPTWMSVYGPITPDPGQRCWVEFRDKRGIFLTGLQ